MKDGVAIATGKAPLQLVPQLDLDRPIYTLGVASEMLDAHPRTLMVYEQLNIVRPQRTPTNRRRYSPRDVMKLEAIQKLTRRHGCNLAGARIVLVVLKQLHDHQVEPPAHFRDVDVSHLLL
jgi:MerR family transcriptional regulator, heat shock protein HspR